MADPIDRGVADRHASLVLWIALALSVTCFAYSVAVSWHWRIVHDAAIMHYVVFLMDHGMAPYRNIIDINMPGAYMAEWLAVHVLGPGDLAWRMTDLLSMLVAIAACCSIARKMDWRAGMLGGLAFALAHLADGAIETGQRDWTMTVLLLVAYACLLHAIREASPAWMALFGLACAAAASLKPLAVPIPVVLLLMALPSLRRDRRGTWPYVGWAMGGAAAGALAVMAFLLRYRAVSAFFGPTRGLVRFYTSVGNMPFGLMTKLALGRYLTLLLLAAFALGLAMKGWRSLEQRMILVGIAFGAALYFAQHKGWGYHRLLLLAFVLLWICVQCGNALHRPGALRWAGGVTLALLMMYVAGKWTRDVSSIQFDEQMQIALERDLQRQGSASLSGRVQCLEMGNGCITDLYRMRLVQSTGFLSDFFLFSRKPVPATEALRMRLMAELQARPPQVIVMVASDWAGGPAAYQPVENSPQFARWLRSHYRLASERRARDGSIERGSYQLYVQH